MAERARFRGVAKVATLVLALIVVGCSGATEREIPSPDPSETSIFVIRPPVDQIFINEAVSFSLVDSENGVTIDRPSWGIASPHNVPGDREIMRFDGLYTAPRLIPEPRTIRIWARSQNLTVFADIEIHDPDRPDTDATARPGDSHTHPVFGFMSFETSKPIEGGLRVGDSVAFSAFDHMGRPLVVDHYEIKHDNKVVDYAGTVTRERVYTAPLVVPDPPNVQISIVYLREGAEPGHLSLLGRSIKIVP